MESKTVLPRIHQISLSVVLLNLSLGEPVWSQQDDSDALPSLGQSQPDTRSNGPASEQALTPECVEFSKDLAADLGDVLRAGCKPTLAQMSKLMDNPLGNVAMFFNQFDLYRMDNPTFDEQRNQGVYTGILQFPKRLNENWNLINRLVFTLPSVPLDQGKIDDLDRLGGSPGIPPGGGPIQESPGAVAPVDLFDGRTTGLGDTYYIGLFSPYDAYKHDSGASSVWGAGFDLAVPTASEDVLGSGKWAAGPSALYAYLGPKWKLGFLAQHYWDFAGDSDRGSVNNTNLQYFAFYSLDDTTSIGAMPNIIANWEQSGDDRFTVPIGIGINKTIQFGKVPVRVGVEFHYSVIKPDSVVGSDWNVRFYVIPAAPSALFEWMQ